MAGKKCEADEHAYVEIEIASFCVPALGNNWGHTLMLIGLPRSPPEK